MPASIVEISIVVPAFNEEQRITSTLRGLVTHLESIGAESEIIVVDDGSRDQTASAVRSLANPRVTVHSLPANRGKGEAVRQGIVRSTGRYLFLVDADLPYALDFLDTALALLREGSVDAVIGARDLPEAATNPTYPRMRRVAGRVFSSLVNLLLPLGIVDTQCGFKGFRAELLRRAVACTTESGFTLDIELLLLYKSWNCSVKRLPVQLLNHDGSRVRLIRDSAKMFWSLLRIAWFRRVGRYPLDPPSEGLIPVLCPLCGESTARPVTRGGGLRFCRCRTCRSVYQNPRPANERVGEFYNAGYFGTDAIESGYTDYYGTLQEQKETAVWLWNQIDALAGSPIGRVLDVGCGSGEFLREGVRRGRECWGVDPVIPRNREGFRFVQGHFPLPGSPIAGKFDLVVFNDTFEHFPDLRMVLAEAVRLTRKGGIVLLNTPDPDSWIARLSGPGWISLKREHLVLISGQAMSRLLTEAGLTEFRRVPSKQIVTWDYLEPRLRKASPIGAALVGPFRRLLPKRFAVRSSGVLVFSRREISS